MRSLNLPIQSTSDVYLACVNGIKNEGLKKRMENIKENIVNAEKIYLNLAKDANLCAWPANKNKNHEIVVGDVTKQELKDLYSYYLVDRGMPGRIVYDSLIAAAPNGNCPLCGTGYAITLDHYLPKSQFPILSVLPQNLVPSCRDCNTGKSTSVAITGGEQSLHPYFDRTIFISEQWLFAEVIPTSPPSLKYFVRPPLGWDEVNKARVVSHFKSLKLAPRFSSLAAEELGALHFLIKDIYVNLGKLAIKDLLESRSIAEFKLHKNSWKSAMFQALMNDDWYCEEGYSLS